MIRLLLADDQELVRTGFRMILDSEPDLLVVGEANNGREAVDRSRELAPDVILMDVRMPILDGIAATRELLAAAPTDPPKVLILTTFDLDEHVYAALAAGASGFLLKDVPASQLADAVRIVSRGDALLAPTVTRRLISRFVGQRLEGSGADPERLLDPLTAREREVLALIARGLSNSEIAATLVLGESTVKTHVGRIFTKLNVRDRAQAVVVAYEAGLVRAST